MAATCDRFREHGDRAPAERGRAGADLGTGRAADEFAAEAHRQSAVIGTSQREPDDQAFVDAISRDWDAEAGRPEVV
jgi:hypothetical protein